MSLNTVMVLNPTVPFYCTFCPRLCVLIDTLGEINKRIINLQTYKLRCPYCV